MKMNEKDISLMTEEELREELALWKAFPFESWSAKMGKLAHVTRLKKALRNKTAE